MKRLLLSLLTAVGLLLPATSAAAVARYWTVDIYEPAATSNRTLNVEYKVFSTVAPDTFTVELFENSKSKGTQSITNPNGDSGVFNITLPATGTYSYFVKATNHGAGNATKNSKTVTVQINNAPQPTVTTVTVAQPAAAPAGGAGGGAGVAGGGTAAPGGAGGGAPVAGQAAPGAVAAAGDQNAGTVTDQAANTGDDNNQDVLGTQASANRARQNRNRNWLVAGAVLLAAGAGYIFYRRRAIANE